MTWVLHNIFVLYRDRGKITNKSITETEGSLIYTFNNSPTKLEEICYVSKDIYSKEHSYTLKLGRDSGMSFLWVQLKCFVLCTADNSSFYSPSPSLSSFPSSH